MNGPPIAEAQHHELADAQMVDQADVVVGVGVPWPVGLERARRLAAIGVAQIRCDDAIFVFELVKRIERMCGEAGNRRVQPAARDDQQRKAGASLFVMDANIAFFVERHRDFPCS